MWHLPSPPFCSEIFRKYQLNIADIAPGPKRLKNKVGEPKNWQILYELLAQIMVNPKKIVIKSQFLSLDLATWLVQEVLPKYLVFC